MLRRAFRPFGTNAAIILFVLSLAATVTVAFKTRAAQGTAAAALTQQAAATVSPLPDERVESEIVTIRPTGFEPSRITRPPGKFYLFVENLTGLGEVNLRLEALGAARLFDVRVPLAKRDWRQLVELPPGEYSVTEADHPNWVCRVTIASPSIR